MTISIRPAEARGQADFGWLQSRHSFSFGQYHDPEHMGFGALRVINDDRVAPGAGFGMHPHRDMEIITVVLEGALEHRDSLGTGSVIRPGDVQKMSAGTGIRHSEFNHSATEPVHFLQIWIEPAAQGVPPSYAEAHIPASEWQGRFRLVAAPDGRGGALPLHQDAEFYLARLAPGETAGHTTVAGRRVWLEVASGRVRLQENELGAGDGAAIEGETSINVTGIEESELLLFDLPA